MTLIKEAKKHVLVILKIIYTSNDNDNNDKDNAKNGNKIYMQFIMAGRKWNEDDKSCSI